MQSAVGLGLRAGRRGCLHVVFVAVALPIDRGDRSTDCAGCRRRDDSDRVKLDASIVEGPRRHDDLGVSVVKTAHTGIDGHPGGACRFVSRRDCRGVSVHRMHHSIESHGGMALLLDCASALKAPSESLEGRADIACLAFLRSSLLALIVVNQRRGGCSDILTTNTSRGW